MVWKFSFPFRKTDDNANRSDEKRNDQSTSKISNRFFRRSRRSPNPIHIDVEYHEEKTVSDANEMLDDECDCQSPTALSSCGFQSRSGSFDFTDQDSGVILRSSCGDIGQNDKGLYSEIIVELPKTSSGTIDIVIGGGADQTLKTPIVQRIIPSSHTAKTKTVNIGDQVVSINGQSVEKMKLAKIQHLIKHSKSPVKFLFQRQIMENVDGNVFTSDLQVLPTDYEEVPISPSDSCESPVKETPPENVVPAATEHTRQDDRPRRPISRNDPSRHSLRSYNPVLSSFGQAGSPQSPTKLESFVLTTSGDDANRTPTCATSSDDSGTLTIFRSRSYSAPINRQASAIYQDDMLQLSPTPSSKSSSKTIDRAPVKTSAEASALVLLDDVDPWPARFGNSSRRLFKSKSFSMRSPEASRPVVRERCNSRSDAATENGKQLIHSRSAYDRLRSSFRKRRGRRTINGQNAASNGSHEPVTLKSMSTSSLNSVHVKLIRTAENRKVYKFLYDCMLDLGVSVGGGMMSTYGDCPPFVQNIRPGSLADGSFNIGDVFTEINGKSTRKMTSSEVTALLRDNVNRKVYIAIESSSASVLSPKTSRSL